MSSSAIKAKYLQVIQESGGEIDPHQLFVIKALQKIDDQLQVALGSNQQGVVTRIVSKFLPSFVFKDTLSADDRPSQGLYLWGGVGRGKTFLMDVFFEACACERKERTHFHRFMQSIHAQLTKLQGQKNPLQIVAQQIARRVQLLALDEFFVKDIGDAMILARLLEALFAEGIYLVTTSNVEPSRLYQGGLQRELFLPAIALLQQHTEVLEMAVGEDYRLRRRATTTVIAQERQQGMRQIFDSLATGEVFYETDLTIRSRVLRAEAVSQNCVWFQFSVLCDGPRSVVDYIELATRFQVVLISDIPQMTGGEESMARRFVYLIDELYDRGVSCYWSSDVSIADLYTGSKVAFEFDRTRSRLREMQALDV